MNFPLKIDELPPLRGRSAAWRFLALLLVLIGVTIGVTGSVRSAGIFVAIGSALYSYLSFTTSVAKRKVEIILPWMISLLLVVVSITLPHAN